MPYLSQVLRDRLISKVSLGQYIEDSKQLEQHWKLRVLQMGEVSTRNGTEGSHAKG